jgi:uncharacterized peroxidase-related enzyme
MWIRRIEYQESSGHLRELYDRVKGPHDAVDDVMKAHSLRPHTMEGHSALYKAVLHHAGNASPVWWLEVIGIYTSLLNQCAYSVAHHLARLSRLLGDPGRAAAIRRALAADDPAAVFAGKELALLRYARKLTLRPGEMVEADVAALREAGATDEEIFEANQVVAYFFASTPHRVVNRSGRERFSIPVFLDPDHDTVVECLPSCRSPEEPPRYPPTTCGAYITARFDAVFAYRRREA